MRQPYTDRPDVRDRLRPWLVPARQWSIVGLHWWQITLSIFAGICIWTADGALGTLLLAPAALWLRFQISTLMEMSLERARRTRTPRELALKVLGDLGCDLCIYLPLGLHMGSHGLFMVAFAMLTVVAELCGLLVFVVGGRWRHDGPMDDTRRAFWISLPALWLGLGLPHLPPLFTAWIAILAGLVIVTGINRVEFGLEEMDINTQHD